MSSSGENSDDVANLPTPTWQLVGALEIHYALGRPYMQPTVKPGPRIILRPSAPP
jgi:hypothetical protein